MTHIRIELHLTPKETKTLDKIAKQQGRSRKNLCETEIRKLIQSFDNPHSAQPIDLNNK